MWNRALATVWCTYCRPHLPKVLWSRCLWFWSGSRALATVLRIFRRQLSQIEPWTRGNRDPIPVTPGATLPENAIKSTGFRARECFHLWIHSLPNCYTSQLLDDGWLTWWCGWHDGGNADHMTIVHKLRSFLTKLPLTMATCRTPLSGTLTCDIIPQEHMLTLPTESSSSLPSILVVVWPQGSVILGHLGTLKIMELVNYHNSRTQYKEIGLYMAILGSHISFRFIFLVIGF